LSERTSGRLCYAEITIAWGRDSFATIAFTALTGATNLLDRYSRARVGMLFKEMTQCHEQFRRMFDAAVIKCLMNVINDHCTNCFAAVRALHQIIGKRGSCYFGYVLVFADRSDLRLVEATKRNAVF